MADFGDEIVGLGHGVKAAIQGYYDMKHFQAREREDEAKLKAAEENKRRQIFMDRMEAKKSGFLVPDDPNDLYSAPLEFDPESYEGILNERRKAQALKIQNDLKGKGVDLSQYGMQLKGPPKSFAGVDKPKESKGIIEPGLIERKSKGFIQQKPMKLNSEDRKRVDNIVMGRQALNDMAKSLGSGSNTFSLVGDNDFTFARTRWEEAIGRMQSGGAIQKDEAERFRKLIPKVTDSEEMQWEKLQKMQKEMDQRLSRFGLKPEDVKDYSDPDAEKFIGARSGNQLQGPPQDQNIADYAKQYGLDYKSAERILRNRGYGQ